MFNVLVLETILPDLEHKVVKVKYRKANGDVKTYEAIGGRVDGHLYYLGFITKRNIGNGYRYFSLIIGNILTVEYCGEVLFETEE